MSDVAIKVENLHKLYLLGAKDEIQDTFVTMLLSWLKAPVKNFQQLRKLNTFNIDSDDPNFLHALQDISFEVKQGEVLGIIGRNGAGKSTLLKVLSRITEPTAGRISINGRVASLLEVGTGFHPELTGRENIYMNGTILGMTKKEINSKFEEIVDFSGVERFLDTPIKRYSSGMKVRLAFSVAAHLEPEILIIDEVLAVGDIEFQNKCLGKMQEVSSGGKTVLFVSHNLGAIQSLCSRGILLNHGQMIDDGPSASVVKKYLSNLDTSQQNVFSLSNPDRKNTGEFRLTTGYLADKQGQPIDKIISGEFISINFEYESDSDLDDLTVILSIFNSSGVAVTNITTDLKGFIIRSTGRSGTITCSIAKNPFSVDDYRISIAVVSYGKQLDLIPRALSFSVVDSIFFGTSRVPSREYCTFYVDHDWAIRIK